MFLSGHWGCVFNKVEGLGFVPAVPSAQPLVTDRSGMGRLAVSVLLSERVDKTSCSPRTEVSWPVAGATRVGNISPSPCLRSEPGRVRASVHSL